MYFAGWEKFVLTLVLLVGLTFLSVSRASFGMLGEWDLKAKTVALSGTGRAEMAGPAAAPAIQATGAICPDFDSSGSVDLEDVQVVANVWHASATQPGSGYNSDYDLNSNNQIDVQDIAQVVAAMGPCGESVVFVGAGDIGDCSTDDDELTAQLLDNIPGTVYTVGDNAYPDGAAADYTDCYEPTWGRHKARTRPAIGDNEYNTGTAAPYFNYFGTVAGDPDKGYYSYDLANWHIIVLNSNCSKIGGCEPDSPQGQWLQADLAA